MGQRPSIIALLYSAHLAANSEQALILERANDKDVASGRISPRH